MAAKNITVIPLKAPLVREGDDVIGILWSMMSRKGLKLEDRDVVAIADKVLAISEERMVDCERLPVSNKAIETATKYGLEPGFTQIVLDESEMVYGGVYRAILSVNKGILIANAGVDHKNAPPGKAALWPKDPDLLAKRIRKELERRSGKRIGVIIVDSKVNPMRRGTVGVAIGSSGIVPIIDCRDTKDLFGRSLKITFLNVLDDLASMAHLAMGEVDERTPFVLIRNAPIIMDDRADSTAVKIPENECLIMKGLKEHFLHESGGSND
ncbi:MAG: coenzyme F420-0:L-glutamate ligase [Nitrososphaeria archaeon]